VRPLPPRAAAPILSSAIWKTLVDEPLDGDERAEAYFWQVDALPVAWSAWQPEVLSLWIRQHPGSRPSCWWRYSAPEPQRRRLGGVGVPIWEVLRAHTPQFYLGVPALWLSCADIRFYSETMKRQLDAEPLDENFPPLFESQTAYLRRHGLLTASEARRSKPFDYASETVTAIL